MVSVKLILLLKGTKKGSILCLLFKATIIIFTSLQGELNQGANQSEYMYETFCMLHNIFQRFERLLYLKDFQDFKDFLQFLEHAAKYVNLDTCGGRNYRKHYRDNL